MHICCSPLLINMIPLLFFLLKTTKMASTLFAVKPLLNCRMQTAACTFGFSVWWRLRSLFTEKKTQKKTEGIEKQMGNAPEGEENGFSYWQTERGRAWTLARWWYRSWGKSSSSLFNILISPSLPHHASPLHFIHSEGNTPMLSSGRALLFTISHLSCSLCLKLLMTLFLNRQGKNFLFFS